MRKASTPNVQCRVVLSEESITDANLDELRVLMRQLTSRTVTLTRKKLREMIKTSHLVIAKDMFSRPARIIGCGVLAEVRILSERYGEVHDMVVDEGFRRSGVASMVLEELIFEASNRDLSFLQLTSKPEREEANALYRRRGFEPRETNVYRLRL